MITRRAFLKYTGGTVLTLFAFTRFGVRKAIAQIPGGTLNLDAVPKFVMPLLIPPVMPKAGTIVLRGGKNADYYEIPNRAAALPAKKLYQVPSVAKPAGMLLAAGRYQASA